MNKTRVSKAYRGGQHVGFKKTVGGREWFLVYGISDAHPQTALAPGLWLLALLGITVVGFQAPTHAVLCRVARGRGRL